MRIMTGGPAIIELRRWSAHRVDGATILNKRHGVLLSFPGVTNVCIVPFSRQNDQLIGVFESRFTMQLFNEVIMDWPVSVILPERSVVP
jgi:hypothetical protein